MATVSMPIMVVGFASINCGWWVVGDGGWKGVSGGELFITANSITYRPIMMWVQTNVSIFWYHFLIFFFCILILIIDYQN